MNKSILIFLLIIVTINESIAQNDSLKSDTHIFWSEEYSLKMEDFTDTISIKKNRTNCKEINMCWGAYVGLFSILDEPKKKRKRGKLIEKVYFAPAFDIKSSYKFTKDSLDFAKQTIVFDMYELAARKCRIDLIKLSKQMPGYGTLYIHFKTIESSNLDLLNDMVGTYTNEVYIQNNEEKYYEWRALIDELLASTEDYKTSNIDRIRFINNKPISKDYQMAKTIIGNLTKQE